MQNYGNYESHFWMGSKLTLEYDQPNSATFMYKLTLDDSDWEVRIRACEFLAAVWEHCVALDERADYRARAAKRLKDSATENEHTAPNWWFYDIKGDKILIEATLDASRLVRLSSVETLKKMKASIEERLRNGSIVMAEESLSNVDPVDRDFTHKRKESDAVDNHPHVAFYRALCKLDFERLDATTSVEQLYQEVLDVERVEHVVMAESEQANDGNNVLDCYA